MKLAAVRQSSQPLRRKRTNHWPTSAVLKQEPDNAAAAIKLRAVEAENFPDAGAAEKAAREASATQMTQPRFRTFLFYDPKPTLRKVSVPVLAINGGGLGQRQRGGGCGESKNTYRHEGLLSERS